MMKNTKEGEILNKKNSGITLVALVVTIVVLIILAVISINIIIDNGILTKAKDGTDEYNKQTASEIMTLKITNYQMKSYAENGKLPDLQYLADMLCDDNDIAYVELEKQKTGAINEKKSIGENTSIFTKLEQYPYEFEINSSLQLASVDGIKVATNDNSVTISKDEYNSLLAKIEKLENNIVDKTIYTGTVKSNEIKSFENVLMNQFVCPKDGIVIVTAATKTSETKFTGNATLYYSLSKNGKRIAGNTYQYLKDHSNNLASMSQIIEVKKGDIIDSICWSTVANSHDENTLHIKYIM